MRYFISISYRGANYSGWQIQDNAPSVEAEVEMALSILLGHPTDVTGAGRTDAGVNAKNFIAHFDSDNSILVKDPEKLIYKINAILPSDICVTGFYPVAEDAHARFDAISRSYKYFVHRVKDPFCANFSYFYKFPLDIGAMNKGAEFLLGEKDFSCFEKLHGGNATSICNVSHAKWKTFAPEVGNYDNVLPDTSDCGDYLVFSITANRFLRNMVRAIVGSLLEVGRGQKDPQWIKELLETKDRCAAGQSVPGHALILNEIKYPYFEIKH